MTSTPSCRCSLLTTPADSPSILIGHFREAIRYALILGFFGFVMRGVDNFAHAGGFFGGYLAARVLDPLKPERIDHIVIALICIAVAFLAIAASVVTLLPIVMRQ